MSDGPSVFGLRSQIQQGILLDFERILLTEESVSLDPVQNGKIDAYSPLWIFATIIVESIYHQSFISFFFFTRSS